MYFPLFSLIRYLAATVLIRPDSELFILCANSLKKAFLSKNKVFPILFFIRNSMMLVLLWIALV